MPPKRKATDSESGPAKKKTTTAPKLKKSKAPSWSEVPEYSSEKPTGEWARKCVDRWCLLPPYDTSISEDLWEDYYNERAALDQVNSSGAPESKGVVSEDELCQDTWKILRKNAGDLAAVVLGSKLDDEERKKQIARTLIGSLYFLELWGNDDDGTPREVQSRTRLYSPFGTGGSVDLFYRYHYRLRTFMNGERFASLFANSRLLDEIDPENPTACSAVQLNKGWKAAPDAVTVFDRNGSKSKGTTAANIKTFEEALFNTDGWLSPMKLVEILFAAGGVMRFKEGDRETPKSVLKKFNYFAGETDGRTLLAQELKALAELEAKEPSDQAIVSIPQRLLLLARHDGGSGSEAGPSE